MALKVYNTLTRQREGFVPLHPGFVGIYVCGPTVYDDAHIGHAKGYISFDIVVRYLRYLGYRVRYVQNITDVGHLTDDADEGEDKILQRAARDEVQPMELVEAFMRSYFEDMDALNVVRPDISPRASGHILEQIELIKVLLERGFAYEVDGSVYFSVESFPEYGKLSGRRVEELEEGARIAVNPEKRNPADFALWKRAEPGHILRWSSPWGWGYPGWHLECSTMAMKYLGQTVDIRGGGLENIFPHNECEIAQSEGATGKPFAKYWLHWNMVTVDGVKMGKSLGNFTTIKQALQKYSPLAIRFFILTSHYRSPLDFSEDALSGAARGLERLHGTVRLVRAQLQTAPPGDAGPALEDMLSEHKDQFLEAMDDDFNTATAIGILFELNREVNALLHGESHVTQGALEAVDALYRELGDQILGIIPEEAEELGGGLEVPLNETLIEVRRKLREDRQWELSDNIRDRMSELGITLEDRPDGTTWRLTA